MAPKPEDTHEDAGTEVQKPSPEKTEEKPETAGDVLETTPRDKPDAKMVPEAAFLAEKKARRAAEKALKDMKGNIEDGASAEEVASEIDDIADEYGIEPAFLKKLARSIKSQADKDADDKIASHLKPFEEKEREAKIDAAFRRAYSTAMEKMPEFANVANPEVIKTLSLQPANANKTFQQIIEETYGNALTGKRTIDTTKPGGGKEPEALDFARARKDSKYFDEVMASPKLKEEYNERMLKEGF